MCKEKIKYDGSFSNDPRWLNLKSGLQCSTFYKIQILCSFFQIICSNKWCKIWTLWYHRWSATVFCAWSKVFFLLYVNDLVNVLRVFKCFVCRLFKFIEVIKLFHDNALCVLYNVMIVWHLICCNTVWGKHGKQLQISFMFNQKEL